MSLGPRPYPVIYDTTNGLQYVFESGPVGIDVDNNAITALTGDVTATGPGSVAATVPNATVIGKVLTGYVSGAGTVADTDTILQAVNKLNGNNALKMPLAGGAFTGAVTFTGTTFAFTPPKLTTTQQNALTAVEGMCIYNTTDHTLAFYNGSAWKEVATV